MIQTIDLEFNFRTFSPANIPLLPAGTALHQPLNFNQFELLLMIGRLTTPTPQHPFDLRTIYAILRYGWAISGDPNFRFVRDVQNIDFRLKTLMSEDFGIGFCGIIMREFFNCDFAGATSVLLHGRPRGAALNTRATPDFIGLRSDGTRLIFESKGTQTNINYSNIQIDSGKNNQIRPFQTRHINLPGFVVGSFLSRTGSRINSRIRVVDPYGNKRPSEENFYNKPNFETAEILRSHYYRLATFVSGLSWPYEEWRKIGLKGLLRSSENIEFMKTKNGNWWYRGLRLPNIPTLPWIDKNAKAISVNIGIADKVVNLFEDGSWNKILSIGKEGLSPESFFREIPLKNEFETIWKTAYKDGMAVIVKLIY